MQHMADGELNNTYEMYDLFNLKKKTKTQLC